MYNMSLTRKIHRGGMKTKVKKCKGNYTNGGESIKIKNKKGKGHHTKGGMKTKSKKRGKKFMKGGTKITPDKYGIKTPEDFKKLIESEDLGIKKSLGDNFLAPVIDKKYISDFIKNKIYERQEKLMEHQISHGGSERSKAEKSIQEIKTKLQQEQFDRQEDMAVGVEVIPVGEDVSRLRADLGLDFGVPLHLGNSRLAGLDLRTKPPGLQSKADVIFDDVNNFK